MPKQELPIGELTPEHCYRQLAGESSHSYLFEVRENDRKKVYLGFFPGALFVARSGDKESFRELKKFLKERGAAIQNDLPQVYNSAFGFVSYDANRYLQSTPPSEKTQPDMVFCVFEAVLVFDYEECILTIAAKSHDLLRSVSDKIHSNSHTTAPPKSAHSTTIHVDMDDKRYREILVAVKKLVDEGEAQQVVISRTFSRETLASPLQIWSALKEINPTPYMFIFKTPDFALIGSSPEKMVNVKDRTIEVAVLGGSHPRNESKSEKEQGEELLEDAKEVAEHNMKMETAKKDAAALVIPSSLQTLELRGFRMFSHILHIISRFGGKLREELDAVDAIQSVLPSATITGFPKQKAIELIDRYEASKRGIYGGALCQLDFSGNATSCVIIRTIVLEKGKASFRAGAAIVSNSDLDYEVRESILKAHAAMDALKKAEEYTV